MAVNIHYKNIQDIIWVKNILFKILSHETFFLKNCCEFVADFVKNKLFISQDDKQKPQMAYSLSVPLNGKVLQTDF